jgi:hypothetical protein
MKTKTKAEATISAVIIRADGTREDLGMISRETLNQKMLHKIKEIINGNRSNNSR